MWFCKDTGILQTYLVLLLDVLYLLLILFQINCSIVFLSHVFGFLFLCCKELNTGQYVLFGSKSVSGNRRRCRPSLKRRGQVGTGAPVPGSLLYFTE